MSGRIGTPGSILPGGIVVIDEPEHVNVTAFADTGDVLVTFNTRPGGDCGQVIIGLSANQVVELVRRLRHNIEHSERAEAEGRGGTRFPDRASG
jgi:hypothetical protein